MQLWESGENFQAILAAQEPQQNEKQYIGRLLNYSGKHPNCTMRRFKSIEVSENVIFLLTNNSIWLYLEYLNSKLKYPLGSTFKNAYYNSCAEYLSA